MYLFGASGHAKVIIDIINSSTSKKIEKVFDDNPKHSHISGIAVEPGKTSDLNISAEWIIAIGNNLVRKRISKILKGNFLTAIHYSALISKSAIINEGSVVMAGVIINPEVIVGLHCIINSGSILEHECIVGDYAHISPGVSLAGNVTVGEGTHVGIGATVIQGITIGKWCTIGAGSVIIRDVPDYSVVVGNPGKIIKIKDEKEFI